jgi:hypothetical protein
MGVSAAVDDGRWGLYYGTESTMDIMFNAVDRSWEGSAIEPTCYYMLEFACSCALLPPI